MKILVNNYLKEDVEDKNTTTVECSKCGSVLEICENDLYGQSTILCPCCKRMFEVDTDELFVVTTENISYPKHFTVVNANSNKNIKRLTDSEINNEIKIGIEFLKKNKNQEYYFISYGEMFLSIFNFEEDGEYMVIVTKNFSEAFVSSLDENSLTLEK